MNNFLCVTKINLAQNSYGLASSAHLHKIPPLLCAGEAGEQARAKGVNMGRAGYGVISSLVVLFAIIQAVQPRSDKK